MQYRKLGKTGLKVSDLCLGAMNFGWTTSEEDSHTVLNHFVAAGGNFSTSRVSRGAAKNAKETIFNFAASRLRVRQNRELLNFIDTADVYAGGKSEEILGRWLKTQPRDLVIVATKVRFGAEPNNAGLSRHHILIDPPHPRHPRSIPPSQNQSQ